MSAYSITTRGLAGRKVPQATLTPMGALLFGSSEPGAWYDTSDMSTLFQDSAGTVPVTAVEQPVGRILDKSGRGNHATQATTTKRPVLSRRVNLLTKTEDINNAAWSKPGVSVISSGVLAPDGTMSAFTIKAAAGAGSKILWYLQSGPTSATPYTSVVWIRNRSVIPVGSYIRLVNTFLGVIAGSHRQFPTVASGWVQMSISGTHAGASGGGLRLDIGTDGTEEGEWDIWHPSLTLATDAHLPYQRVNTATDYDADPAKFPAYLRFDGVDDALQTGNIDFTGTDKMTVWAGVTKLSDAAPCTLLELSVNSYSNLGTIGLFTPTTVNGNDIAQRSIGTSERVLTVGGFTSPMSFVVTGYMGITPPIIGLRIAGSVIGTTSASQGTGNYGNYPLYIGARAGTSLYFNGRLYSMIIRGAQSSLSQIEATEVYIKQKMRLP